MQDLRDRVPLVRVIGGGSAASTDAVQTLGRSGGGSLVGHLPTPRSDLVAAAVGGRVYAMGGYDGTRLSPTVLASRDGRSFSVAARLKVPVRYPAVAAAGGTIYLFGGETSSGQATDAIQAIDASTGRARVLGRLPSPLAHASAVTLGGKPYVLGGTARGTPSDRILTFDPASRRTTPAGRLPEPVTNAAAASIGGRGYLIGGLGPGGAPLRSVVAIERIPVRADASPKEATSPASTAPESQSGGPPFRGRLLIADRGNNRLLVVNSRKRVLWRYPGSMPKGRRGASTSPTTPSSSTTGGESSPTRRRTRRSWSSRYTVGAWRSIRSAIPARSGRARLLPRARRRLPSSRRDGHGRRRAGLLPDPRVAGRLPGPGADLLRRARGSGGRRRAPTRLRDASRGGQLTGRTKCSARWSTGGSRARPRC